MKVLILCAHRPRRSPSQRYRFEQYLPWLESKGFSFQFSYLLTESDDKTFYSSGRFIAKVFILLKSVLIRFKDLFRFRNFDVLLIQREASFLGTSFFEKMAYRSGKRVVFDFDDSIWLADTSPGNKKWEWVKRPAKFFDNVRFAHTVMAGNHYLAAKASALNPDTVVVPTTIDTELHVPKPELRGGAVLCLGWSGSISTVRHFETLIPVFLRLKKKYGKRISFKLVGDAAYRHPELEVESIAWTEATEVDVLNSFDIGLMPLPNDEWARGKCGLKGLACMACEVPVVMSPVGVNQEIISHGCNGLLATTEEEWLDCLSQLIDNPTLRKQLGETGRRTVIANYSVRTHQQRYFEILNNEPSKKY